MDYEKMELDDLKEYAKSIDIPFGKIGKEKLIEKIKEKETVSSASEDNDPPKTDDRAETNRIINKNTEPSSLLDSIISTIDDLDDSTSGELDELIEDLPMDTVVNVKSITYGGLTYKSRTTNAVLRWNQIGAVQPMTISEINEMNNYKSEFLRKPLVILMDDRAIRKFRLTSVYENVAKINNLTAVFNSDMKTVERVVDDAIRVNMRDVLISKVRQMYKTKKLVDINIIRLLERKLKFDLSESE